MADLDAVRQQLQELKERLSAGAITADEYDRLRDEATAKLTAEDHIELGVLTVSQPGAEQPGSPAAAEPATPPEPAAPASAMPTFPDLDESVFQEEVPPPEPTPPPEGDTPPEPAPEPPSETPRRWLLPALAAAVVTVVLIVAGVLMLRPSPEPAAPEQDTVAVVSQLLTDSQSLFDAGNGEDAVRRLEAGLGQLPSGDPARARIERRLRTYRDELARPTPSPAAGVATEVEELLGQGQRLAAYRRVIDGLQLDPANQALLDLEERLGEDEPLLRSLHTAVQAEDYSTAAFIVDRLTNASPEQPEYAAELRRCLFNAAVLDLRGHNIADAREHLDRLATLEPGDTDVQRMVQITEGYTKKEPDAQLDIFAGSLRFR